MTHKKIWHAMTNIDAIHSKHKKSWIATNTCDALLPNGMPHHYQMENQVVINRRRK